jgi:hypothetical protein
MTDGQVEVVVAVVGGIFTAGGILTWARMSIAALRVQIEVNKQCSERDVKTARADLYRDVNGLGNRVRLNEDNANRRYHNTSAALLIAAPNTKESEIAALLREGS